MPTMTTLVGIGVPSKYFTLSPPSASGFRGDVVARQPAHAAADEVRSGSASPSRPAGRRHSPARPARRRRRSRRPANPARAPAWRTTLRQRAMRPSSASNTNASGISAMPMSRSRDHAVLQEAHRREDRPGAAEGIGQGEPVGQMELAQHREMALLHRLLRCACRQSLTHRARGLRGVARAVSAASPGVPPPVACPSAAPWPPPHQRAIAALPSRCASTRSSAAYTYGNSGR